MHLWSNLVVFLDWPTGADLLDGTLTSDEARSWACVWPESQCCLYQAAINRGLVCMW